MKGLTNAKGGTNLYEHNITITMRETGGAYSQGKGVIKLNIINNYPLKYGEATLLNYLRLDLGCTSRQTAYPATGIRLDARSGLIRVSGIGTASYSVLVVHGTNGNGGNFSVSLGTAFYTLSDVVTVRSVDPSGKRYMHNLMLGSTAIRIVAKLINADSTPITTASLLESALKEQGYTINNSLPCRGLRYLSDTEIRDIVGLYAYTEANGAAFVSVSRVDGATVETPFSEAFTDTVIEIGPQDAFQHNINIQVARTTSSSFTACVQLYTPSSVPMDIQALYSYLTSIGISGFGTGMGVVFDGPGMYYAGNYPIGYIARISPQTNNGYFYDWFMFEEITSGHRIMEGLTSFWTDMADTTITDRISRMNIAVDKPQTKIYVHNIYMKDDGRAIMIQIPNNSPEEFTRDTLITFLQKNAKFPAMYPANGAGRHQYSGNAELEVVVGAYGGDTIAYYMVMNENGDTYSYNIPNVEKDQVTAL